MKLTFDPIPDRCGFGYLIDRGCTVTLVYQDSISDSYDVRDKDGHLVMKSHGDHFRGTKTPLADATCNGLFACGKGAV